MKLLKKVIIKQSLIKEYVKPFVSVYAIVFSPYNRKKTNKYYIASSIDTDRKVREHFLNLSKGKHRNKEMQTDYNKWHKWFFKYKNLMKIRDSDKLRMNINELYSKLDRLEQQQLNKFKNQLYNKRVSSRRTIGRSMNTY